MNARTGSSSIVTWSVLGLLAFGSRPATALAQGGLPHLIDPPPGSVQFGRSVASGGDANGDGVDDLFISDPGFDVDGVRVGRWFVYDGATREMMWGAVGGAPLGISEMAWSHLIVGAFIGDINGDGGSDLIVGIPTTQVSHGAVFVYSGHSGDVLHRYDGGEHHYLGLDVAGVGDMNRDGTPDLAFIAQQGEEGLVSFRSGRDASLIHETPAIYPRRVRGVGDIDRDGYGDAAIGTYRFGNDPQINIVSGRTGERTTIRSPGGSREDGFGYSLAGGVGVTGDQVPDLLVSSEFLSQRVVYLVSGATGAIINPRD